MGEAINMFFNSWYIYLVFGMVFGSFLNVVIYRLPNGLSIISPPSSCPKCGHRIKWYENIPVLSWLFLKGRCSSCSEPISWEYPAVEFFTGLLTLFLYLYFGASPKLIIYIPLSYILLCIFMIDLKTFSIPYSLNIALLSVGFLGIIMNFFIDGLLPAGIIGSLLGAATGFGILYLIQLAGKFIYKQDAVGTGDIFMLGSAGLIMGPKLTFSAFMIGSLAAVISHTMPAIVNMKNKKIEALEFKELAEKYLKELETGLDNKTDLLGLRMQLAYRLNDPAVNELYPEYVRTLSREDLENMTYLRAFYRFMAIDEKEEAEKALRMIEPEKGDLVVPGLMKVIHEPLIGYNSAPDNLELICSHCKNISDEFLTKKINENKKYFLTEEMTADTDKIEAELEKIKTEKEKLEFLLNYNRYFQYNGFTAEQKLMTQLIEKHIDLSDPELEQRYLSDLSFVYYTDFFFNESREAVKKLKRSLERKVSFSAVKAFFDLSLFRYYFFKQRLAFGPFLAAGTMVSILFGENILNIYFSLMEKLLL